MRKLASRALHRAARLALPLAARLTRPLTLGVRVMIFDGDGRVMLVRHAYLPGWHMPGGGVEPGETTRDALAREVHEETGLLVSGRAELLGLYFNAAMARRDHVAVYIVRAFEVTDRKPDAWEIAEFGFHPVDALPEGTSGPTRRRLAEVLQDRPVDDAW